MRSRRTTSIDDVHKAWETGASRCIETLGPVLATHDVFICPTLSLPAVNADHDPWDPDFRINGVKVDPEYGWVMTHQFNMLHNCPVMAVPSGFAANGVPTGIQIVGRTFDDARVFRAALAYEKAVGRLVHRRRPGQGSETLPSSLFKRRVDLSVQESFQHIYRVDADRLDGIAAFHHEQGRQLELRDARRHRW